MSYRKCFPGREVKNAVRKETSPFQHNELKGSVTSVRMERKAVAGTQSLGSHRKECGIESKYAGGFQWQKNNLIYIL